MTERSRAGATIDAIADLAGDEGAVVVVTDDRIRVRKLPLLHDI